VGFTVFPVWNIEQLKPGYDESKIWSDPNAGKGEDNNPIEAAEKLIAKFPEPAPARKSGNPAYRPSNDTVYMPPLKKFTSSAEFYAALLHELAHATGHAKRLGRAGVKGRAFFGSRKYSREELVAEIAAGILCSLLGLDLEVIENQTAYVKGWLKYLDNDPGALADAASAAQKAVDFVCGTAAN
jgi:antirestriction protein ArdC